MPLYEYRCTICGNQFEALRQMGDHVDRCPVCGGKVQMIFGVFRFKFRSSGWKPYEPGATPGGESIREDICVSE